MTVKAANQTWIRTVKSLFFKLSDAQVVPISHNDWAEKILEMSGWIVDMALLLENDKEWKKDGMMWFIKNCVRRYQESLELLKSGSER